MWTVTAMAVPTRTFAMNMIFSILLGLLMLGPSASAQSASSSSSPSSTSAPTEATHIVNVGEDGFTYSPNKVAANVGDTVLFLFFPQNHSVARAEFGHPCIPYENTGVNKVGFWSGFQPIATASENGPKFALKINDTEPTFFYCSAPGACVPDGMIGVINPNSTQTLAEQLAFVANSTIQLSPGEQNPSESGASPTPSSGYNSSDSDSSSSGLSGGAIAGIVVGAVVVIALAGIAFYLCGRNRTLASVLRYSQPPSRSLNVPPVPYSPSQTRSPYSAEFSPKPGESPTSRPILSSHESWTTQNTGQQVRPTSPEMAASGGMMSPQLFNPAYGSGGYNAVENPGNPLYGGNQSPQASPWAQHSVGFAQTQYAQIPNEMSTGRQPLSSPGQQSHTSQNSQPIQEVHELDARSSAPEAPGAPPPQYNSRTFSFIAGGEAPLGVEKVLRD